MSKEFNILLISGHGAGDTGAIGCGYYEYLLTRELTKLIATELEAYANVDIYDQSRNAFKDVQNGKFNIGKYDYVLEVHFNAYNGKAFGTEIFVTTMEKGTGVEETIMANLSKFFKLRGNKGVKRTNFLVIKTVKNKGISSALIETCFIDNKDDMAKYQANKLAIAKAIAQGIVKGFGLKKVEVAKPVEKPVAKPTAPTYKYQLGDVVNITGVYTSSNSTTKLTPDKKQGKITNIAEGAKNPYLLDNGNIGWVNEACITGEVSASKPTTVKKDLNAVAKKVYNGVYGNEPTRSKKLKAEGYTDAEIKQIQALVNKMCN